MVATASLLGTATRQETKAGMFQVAAAHVRNAMLMNLCDAHALGWVGFTVRLGFTGRFDRITVYRPAPPVFMNWCMYIGFPVFGGVLLLGSGTAQRSLRVAFLCDGI